MSFPTSGYGGSFIKDARAWPPQTSPFFYAVSCALHPDAHAAACRTVAPARVAAAPAGRFGPLSYWTDAASAVAAAKAGAGSAGAAGAGGGGGGGSPSAVVYAVTVCVSPTCS